MEVKKESDPIDQTVPVSGSQERAWWKEAVVYQIYPRSFQDTDGDGIGDLKGIITRLDYVQSLGVDVIWLNPIFDSPNDDNGYDISDYYTIMSQFGTMDDFDQLLKEIHSRGMKLVLDLVVNHSSDEHPWFVQARQSRNSPYYLYYHWWPAEKGDPPFRRSYFDENGYAWKYNEATDSYYLHYFSRKQPDLNWSNPKLRQEIYEIMRFWLNKGIDGFRMDAIPLIGKDPGYPVIDSHLYPDTFSYYATNPVLHTYLQEMNKEVLSKYDILSVGEASAVRISEAWKFVDPSRGELQMIYHFGCSEIRNWMGPDDPATGVEYSLRSLKRMFTDWNEAVRDGWPTIYFGNHDQPRMVSRFGSDKPRFRETAAKMLATFLLTMRGTPYWYAGDELGMTNIRFRRIEDYDDVETRNQYKRVEKLGGDVQEFLQMQKETARDNARTPFQWNADTHAGFTTGKPWLKVNRNYRILNASEQEQREDSPLNYFRRMTVLRKEHPTLIYGTYTLLDEDHLQTYSYLREDERGLYLVVLNFTRKKAHARPGIEISPAVVVVSNYPDPPLAATRKGIPLRPFEAVVYKIG